MSLYISEQTFLRNKKIPYRGKLVSFTRPTCGALCSNQFVSESSRHTQRIRISSNVKIGKACNNSTRRCKCLAVEKKSTTHETNSSAKSVAHGFFQGSNSAPFASLSDSVLDTWEHLEGLTQLEVEKEFKDVVLDDFRIQNHFYESKTHRKLHIELAANAAGLQVVHCVMYPRVEYSLPMYAVDMVGFGPRISLAICDLCPTSQDLALPPLLAHRLATLRANLLNQVPVRPTPDWGAPIFSSEVALVAPESEDHVNAFLQFAVAALGVIREEAEGCAPLSSQEEAHENGLAQSRFCFYQCKNEKTKRILASSMGQEWANKYMTEILFDSPTGFHFDESD